MDPRLAPGRQLGRAERLFRGRDRVAFVAAGDALHLLEEVVQCLVGAVRHLGEGAQEAVGARQLEQRLLAVLRGCRGDQDDIVVVPEYQNVYVSGQVRTPGGYPYEEGLTVLKAVTLAGGFTDKASKRGIKIKRLKGKEEESLSVQLEDSVFPDDVIVIPESFF